MNQPEKIVAPADATAQAIASLAKEFEAVRKELAAKNGSNGTSQGWLAKLLTERMIAFILAGMFALVAWVGVVNVRQAVIVENQRQILEVVRSHEARLNALPSPEVLRRLDAIERRLERLERTGSDD